MMPKRLKQLVVSLVSFALIQMWPGAAFVSRAQDFTLTYEDSLSRLDDFMELIGELRAEIDTTQFDVEALSLELAFEESDTIIEWVRESISFQPYSGLLRGASGTIMSRAGNALDQAVLLARLLNDAGYTTRVSRSRLSGDQAVSLLAQARAPRGDVLLGDVEAMRRILEELAQMGERAGASPYEDPLASILGSPPLDPDMIAEAQDHADSILELVDPSGTPRTELLHEAADYFFVEIYDHATDTWEGAHPAFTDERAAPGGLVVQESFEGSVPPELLHTVTVTVRNERQLGEEYTIDPVFDPWTRPTANLHGVPITYTNVPNNVDEILESQTPDAFANAEYLIPVFMGEPAPGGQVFDLNGNMIDQEAASNAAAGVFRNVGNAFGSAAGALASPGERRDLVALSGQTIEFVHTAPGGKQRAYVRSIYNAAAYANEQAAQQDEVALVHEANRHLTAQTTTMIAAGAIPHALILDRLLARILQMRTAFEVMLAIQHDRTPIEVPDEQLAAVSTAWSGGGGLYALFDAVGSGLEGNTYRSEPHIVMHTRELPVWGVPGERIDILSNTRRSTSSDHAVEQLVTRGVWETLAEARVLSQAGRVVGVPSVFRLAKDEGIPLMVLRSASDAVGSLGWEPDPALLEDLEAGYVVVAPELLPQALPVKAWWRVWPGTGEVLGRIQGGFGGAYVRSSAPGVSLGKDVDHSLAYQPVPYLPNTFPGAYFVRTISLASGTPGTAAREYGLLLTIASAVMLVLIGTSVCMTYVYGVGGDFDNVFTCLGVSVATVMLPFNQLLGYGFGIAIALLDIHLTFEPPEPEECPPGSYWSPSQGSCHP